MEDNKTRLFVDCHVYSKKSIMYRNMLNYPVEMSKPAILSHSPSQSSTIIIRSQEKKHIIELCPNPNSSILHPEFIPFRIEVSKVHGDIIADSWFGGHSCPTSPMMTHASLIFRIFHHSITNSLIIMHSHPVMWKYIVWHLFFRQMLISEVEILKNIWAFVIGTGERSFLQVRDYPVRYCLYFYPYHSYLK